MLTRRESLFTLAGLTGAALIAASLGSAGSALAQGSDGGPTTKSGIRSRARMRAEQAKLKWASLTGEQQEELVKIMKGSAEHVQEKWESMTPEQQREIIAKSKAQGRRAQEKWRKLPE